MAAMEVLRYLAPLNKRQQVQSTYADLLQQEMGLDEEDLDSPDIAGIVADRKADSERKVTEQISMCVARAVVKAAIAMQAVPRTGPTGYVQCNLHRMIPMLVGP